MASWKPVVNQNGESVPCPGCKKLLLESPWGPVCPGSLENRVQEVEPKKMSYCFHRVLYGLHQNPKKCGTDWRYNHCNSLN